MHRILVIGATGRTGVEVVRQGLARGDQVTAFVRTPAKAAALPKAARVVQGDALNAKSVADAIPGHDAVVVAVGSGRVFISAPVIKNVIAGMKAAGVKRVVLLSAYGIGDSGHGVQGFIFRNLLKALNSDKMEAERLLTESGLDWTAVRTPGLSVKPATGRLKGATDVTINGFSRISRADLAAFMLDDLDRNAFVRRKPIVSYA